jgi:hypothetical protein
MAEPKLTKLYRLMRADGSLVKEFSTALYAEAGAKGDGAKRGGTNDYRVETVWRVVASAVVPAPVPTPPPAPTPPAPAPTPPAPAPAGAWVVGPSKILPPTDGRPARGVKHVDSFGLETYRVTDPSDPVNGFARNDYSRRQAFNADNTRQLVAARDGYWHTYRAKERAYEKKLPGLAGDAEPQWHPTNPDLLYYLPQNGLGMKLFELNVATGVSRTVADFGARLLKLWPGSAAAWTRSEGSPSADGRFWCFMVDDASWKSLGVFTWDMQSDLILGHMPTNGDRPDHVSMSPSGRRAVLSFVSDKGTRAYTRDFREFTQLHHSSDHSDLVLMPDGTDAYVSVDYQANAGDVFYTNCETGVRTNLFPSYVGDGSARAFHFSGKCYGVPGWVLVSAQFEQKSGAAMPVSALSWIDRKLFLQELKPGGRVLNVVWHRAVPPTDGSDYYFFSPQGTISRDGSVVAFSSPWGSGTLGSIGAYQTLLPAIK